jgi:SAM-dependent methyltransferase
MNQDHTCPVCGGSADLYDVVDLNKSCEELRGKFLGLSGIPIYYALCNNCSHCFCPEIISWNLKQFEESIYNDDYVDVDPDYKDLRPRGNAANLIQMFQNQNISVLSEKQSAIKHLDYGGGSGLLSRILKESGWQSYSYDPFVDKCLAISEIGKFNLITAFEVFEHVPNVTELMSNIRSLLLPDGIVLFSTLLLDGNINPNERLTWWYASPRNGHINLFSKNSLAILAQQHGFNLASSSQGFHVLFNTPPSWAKHLFEPA